LKNGLPNASLIAMNEAANPPVPFKKLSATNPEFFRRFLGEFFDPELLVFLLTRLRMRHIFAV